MAVFVILIMIAFIMPTLLNQLAKPRSKGPQQAMWYFQKDSKISLNDISQATRELTAMRHLYIDKFLLSQQDFRFILLGQLIFPEAAQGAGLSDEIKSIAMRSQLCISPQRIDDFFEQTGGRAELFWTLLKAEAKNAGCAISPQHAANILNILIPKITDNSIDSRTLVRNVGQANQMTDDMVLGIFADIMAVAGYARIVTETEDVTEAEMAFLAEKASETINAEFVEFSSMKFIDKAAEPGETETASQFEKYKNVYPDIITEENPCSFGYKQGPRVAIEYMIVKLEDVRKPVAPPTEEEAEEFYQQNPKRFSKQVPEDANDPNSRLIERQRSYSEVAGDIKNALLATKAMTKAVKVLHDAVEQAQTGYETLNLETATVRQLGEKTTDYVESAEKIAQQNNIKIYTGKTALLTAEEILADRCLGSLVMWGQSQMPTKLMRMAFALEQLGDEAIKLGPFEPPKPKMYVSFGPLTDSMSTIIAMARVIETKNSQVPDINFSYEKNLPLVFEDEQKEEKVFVLKKNVKQDCKKLAAFDIARRKAAEFAELAKNKGWQEAIDKFNSLYPALAKDADESQKSFKIQNWEQRNRVTQMDIEALKLNLSPSPVAGKFINQTIIQEKLADEFYSLFKADEIQLENTPAVIEFRPQLACYAIKSLTRNLATIEDYEQSRQQIAYREEYIISQSMAFEHFMPDNIIKRLNLRPAHEPNEPVQQSETDTNGTQI